MRDGLGEEEMMVRSLHTCRGHATSRAIVLLVGSQLVFAEVRSTCKPPRLVTLSFDVTRQVQDDSLGTSQTFLRIKRHESVRGAPRQSLIG